MTDTSKRIVSQLLDLLGPAVLLPIPSSQKRPIRKGWQKLTRADMTPDYLASLDHRKNIGVLLGKASNGLCTIDLDDDDHIEPFLRLNPNLAETLRTKGQRGSNLWVHIKGEFPPLGKISCGDRDIGEWRSDGGQTVIWGIHPSGCKYQRVVRAKPVEIAFSDIRWPADWQLPWRNTAESELERQHGAPYTISARSRLSLNTSFFAAKFAKERLTLWHPGEQRFYQYIPKRGLWCEITKDAIKLQFAQDLKAFADETGLTKILNWRTNASLAGLAELLKGHVEHAEAFQTGKRLVHFNNYFLDLATNPPRRLDFSPEFYSRNQIPFDFVDGADCPRFKSELLAAALDPDDVNLLQRYCGAVLTKHNAAQKILLLTGTAGGGKSTLADIIERIIGPENCAELRTDLLFERFELARFIGKTLLSGKDVPGDFLQRRGASALKKLVGHDLLSAELKKANEVLLLRGDFHVICTCNTRLQVQLDSDTDAWRRRLLVIEYSRPKPEKPIRDFADKLLAAEASGILYWMLLGAIQHMAELEENGDYVLSQGQQQRIGDLLNESDSIRLFVQQQIAVDDAADVTTEELLEAYFDFCDEHGWKAKDRTAVCAALPNLILEIHHLGRSHDIRRDGRTQRGYSGLRICPSEQPF